MNLMKKLSVLIIVVLLLSACGSQTTDVDGEDTIEGQAGNTAADRERLSMDLADDALSPALQLVVGTLILEDTDLAVDAELAETLVPYWKLYITLTESDTTAPEELDAIINEIQLLMTPDQVNYIVGLELIQEDMMTMIDELGIFEDLRADGSREAGGLPGVFLLKSLILVMTFLLCLQTCTQIARNIQTILSTGTRCNRSDD